MTRHWMEIAASLGTLVSPFEKSAPRFDPEEPPAKFQMARTEMLGGLCRLNYPYYSNKVFNARHLCLWK